VTPDAGAAGILPAVPGRPLLMISNARSCVLPNLLLLLAWLPGLPLQESLPPLDRRLREIEQRLTEERKLWLESYRACESEDERAELVQAFPLAEYRAELEGIARESPGSDVAARAWIDLYRLGSQLGQRELFQQAVEHLTGECIASTELNAFALELVYGSPDWGQESAEAALRKIRIGSPHHQIQGHALSHLCVLVGQDPARREEARDLLAELGRDYGELSLVGLDGKRFVEGATYEVEHLQVGDAAPDFEARDQDGHAFRLSDYRGRVVLLDFWGYV